MEMIMDKQMDCRLAGETEVLGENLPQRHFCPSQNPTWPNQGLNPGRRGRKQATNRLSYDAPDTETYRQTRASTKGLGFTKTYHMQNAWNVAMPLNSEGFLVDESKYSLHLANN
jgi:hypothetical protein